MFIRSKSVLAITLFGLAILLSCGKKDADSSTPTAPPLAAGITQTLTKSDVAPNYIFDYLGPIRYPAIQKSIEVSGAIPLSVNGWAIDEPNKATAAGVEVVIDQAPYSAHYGIERTDVATHFNKPEYRNSGFELTIPPGQLTKGPHSVSIRVIASDRKSYYQGPVVPFAVN
jgi:hypothetical protein